MNPFILDDDERMRAWKEFRNAIASESEEAQLTKVAAFWSQAPLLKFSYDPEDASTWPSAWEMIHANEWCRLSIAIGMEMTLRLVGWAPERLRLVYFKDFDLSEMFFVVEVDGKHALNYDYGIVCRIPNTRKQVIAEWKFDGKDYKPV